MILNAIFYILIGTLWMGPIVGMLSLIAYLCPQLLFTLILIVFACTFLGIIGFLIMEDI